MLRDNILSCGPSPANGHSTSLPPGMLYQLPRNPPAGNTIHTVPGRELQP